MYNKTSFFQNLVLRAFFFFNLNNYKEMFNKYVNCQFFLVDNLKCH